MKSSTKIMWVTLASTAVLSIACTERPISVAHLKIDAEAVPVPTGVTFTKEGEFIEDGTGLTRAKFE